MMRGGDMKDMMRRLNRLTLQVELKRGNYSSLPHNWQATEINSEELAENSR